MKNEKAAAGIEFLVDGAPAQSCTCQFCGCQMKQSEKLVVCSKCDTPHHDECYQDNRGCTTFACKGSKPIPAGFRNGRIAKDSKYSVSAAAVYSVLDEIKRKVCTDIPADMGELLTEEGLVSVISEKEYFAKDSEASMRHGLKKEINSKREQAAGYQREISRLETRQFWKDLFSFRFFSYFQVHFDDNRTVMEKKADELRTKRDIMRDGLRQKEAGLRRLNKLAEDAGQYKRTNLGYVKLTDAGLGMLEAMKNKRDKTMDSSYMDFKTFFSP